MLGRALVLGSHVADLKRWPSLTRPDSDLVSCTSSRDVVHQAAMVLAAFGALGVVRFAKP